jgi:Calcineurin-like phosphoesterase
MRNTTTLVLASMSVAVLLACTTAVLTTAMPGIGQTATKTVTLVGAGDIARCDARDDEHTAGLINHVLRNLTPDGTLPSLSRARVITIGDNAYPHGNRPQFANCYDNYRLTNHGVYDPSRTAWWGQFKGRTMPALGNHEYPSSSDPGSRSKPYFDYFRAQNGFKAPAAPVPYPGLTKGKGYYGYDLGSWHIVALNSNCDYVGCGGESAQARWLRRDLSNHPARCTLAYMHHPLYATGTAGLEPRVKPLWRILYDHGADVMLNGHDHRYERLARIDAEGDPDPTYGIRPFIAGTGGWPGSGPSDPKDPNSQVGIFGKAGVLRMGLSEASYSWRFVAVDGTANGTVMDSGTQSCHGAPRTQSPSDRR